MFYLFIAVVVFVLFRGGLPLILNLIATLLVFGYIINNLFTGG